QSYCFSFYGYVDHLDLHSFPTRRSSDLERIEALKPAIEACGISTLSQSPMLGFHKQMDNRIKLLEEILSFRMQGVEFDNGSQALRSEERFSRNAETDLVCRLLLEKKKYNKIVSIGELMIK